MHIRSCSVYDAASTTSASLAQEPVGADGEGGVDELREPSTTTDEIGSGEDSSGRIL